LFFHDSVFSTSEWIVLRGVNWSSLSFNGVEEFSIAIIALCRLLCLWWAFRMSMHPRPPPFLDNVNLSTAVCWWCFWNLVQVVLVRVFRLLRSVFFHFMINGTAYVFIAVIIFLPFRFVFNSWVRRALHFCIIVDLIVRWSIMGVYYYYYYYYYYSYHPHI
jgi:hypothetical protein